MTTYTLNVTDAKQLSGIAKAVAAYNAANASVPGFVPLTDAQYLAQIVTTAIVSWAVQFNSGLITPYDWSQRFTTTEWSALLTLSNTNTTVKNRLNNYLGKTYLDVTDPSLVSDMNALVGLGVLANAARVTAILALP
jgi:hypothetical protein